MNTEADGLFGAVLAAQGVKGIRPLINGPGGCRSRMMNLIREMTLEYRGDDECCCKTRYMSRNSMLPCTYLNADDIILGSGAKISDSLGEIIGNAGTDILFIDTLGASIQVADREEAVRRSGYPDKVVFAFEDLSDIHWTVGFDDTMVRILDHYLKEKSVTSKRTVNILGYSMADRSWDFGKEEIRHLLSLLGVEVRCFVGCDCTVKELNRSPEAELNILIHPEMSMKTAEFYRERFGIEYLVPSEGVPVGYDSIRSFLKETAGKLHIDPTDALDTVDDEERRVCRILSNYDKMCNSVRGYSMAAEGLPSDVYPLVKLMYRYFGLIPRSVKVSGGYVPEGLYGFLESIGRPEAICAPVPEYGLKLMMCEGYKAEVMSGKDNTVACIGIAMPHPDAVPLTNRCLVGFGGTRNALDQFINNVKRFTCGQPSPADAR